MLHDLFRDEPHVESLQQMMPAVRAERDAVRALLMRGRPERGRRRVRVAAAIGHAVDFGAWRSLARGDLDDVEAVELMVELVRAAGASRGKLR
jgi:hypothetical protein